MEQGKYDDMLHLPHHQSPHRAHMSMHDRAAQFAPFAALTGYAAAVAETARLTDSRAEPDVDAIAELDDHLRDLLRRLPEKPAVTLTVFRADGKKSGGAYLRLTGAVKKLDFYSRRLIFCDGTAIALDDIIAIE